VLVVVLVWVLHAVDEDFVDFVGKEGGEGGTERGSIGETPVPQHSILSQGFGHLHHIPSNKSGADKLACFVSVAASLAYVGVDVAALPASSLRCVGFEAGPHAFAEHLADGDGVVGAEEGQCFSCAASFHY